jgi:hypothetical protein
MSRRATGGLLQGGALPQRRAAPTEDRSNPSGAQSYPFE